MTTNRLIPITTDTILAIILTDLHDAHARNDLRATIDAHDDLAHFAELNLIDARDSDLLNDILCDDDTFDADADAILRLLNAHETFFLARTIRYLRRLNY